MPITICCCRKVWLVSIVLFFSGAGYGVAADWKPNVPRTAYVNLFEWSWPSIAQECITQLGPKGYAAVQVSPPQEHIKGGQWWTRYQPVSYKIFSRSGDRHEFSAMVKACKAAGVDIYVDTVINHMASGIRGIGVAGSFYGNYNYPAAGYTLASFHQPSCSIRLSDYESQRANVTQCDIPGLPDLDTGKAEVQDTIAAYMKDLLSLGVAGFRVDAAKHIRPEELAAIKAKVPGDYFFTLEVQKDASVYNSGDMDRYLGLGTVNEFSFMYAMKNMFLNLFGYNLSRMPEAFATWGMFPTEKATVFVNNHDSERSFCDKFSPGAICDSLSLFNGDQLFLANIFMLGYPYGYPQVMSGFYFDNQDMGPVNQPYSGVELLPRNCSRDPLAVGKWDCVHRDNRVANMVGFRNYTEGAPLLKWSSEGENRIAFNRGNKGFVAINNTATTWEKKFDVGVPDANYCNLLVSDFPELGVCPERARVKVANGQAEVAIAPNSALALHFGAIVKADSIADIPLINVPDSLNLVRGQAIISRKTKYIGFRPALLSAGDQAQISVAGGDFSWGPVLVKPGQNLQIKTTAPITDHTVKLVHITLGSSIYLWKLATSGAICSDTYCPSITPLDYTPSVITAGKPVTLFYLGSLANSAALTLRWGYNESNPLTDIAMTRRSDGFWSATITPPLIATRINFLVTDGINVDMNSGSNGSLPVVPAVDTSVTITFKVTANTLPGESVYIVGNRPELGNWSTLPDSARQCTASAGSQWACSIRFPVGGLVIEYKYQKIGNGMLTWENGGNYTYLLPNTNTEVDNGAFR